MKEQGIFASVRRMLGLDWEPEEPVNPNLIYYPVFGGNIYFDKSNGTVTGCDNSITGAIIPEEIEGVPVTTIGSNAFRASGHCLTTVSIPESVTAIQMAAFGSCYVLRKINIPKSVTFIGVSAFLGCASLIEITIPDGVTSLYSNTFFDCQRLTSISLPNSITSIDNGAFSFCSSLTNVYYGGTQEEYETNLLPRVSGSNTKFLDATFHFKEDAAPEPAESNQTALYGTLFLLLAALTVYALVLRPVRNRS